MVIEGGANTIHDSRPIIYVENDRREKSSGLIELLLAMEYSLWWHLTPLFNENNFAGNTTNVFGRVVSINMLCVPNEKVDEGIRELVAKMPLVSGPEDYR